MSLIVATDLSTRAAAAVRYAEDLAERLDEALAVVHVAPDTRPDIADDATDALKLMMREYAAEPQRHECRVVVGDTIPALVKAAAGQRLLVCGATGSSYLDDIFLGSTASRLIREAPCPVVVVPDEFVPGLKNVIVAMGFDEASRAALNLAESLVESGDAKICLLHVLPDDTSDEHEVDVRERLAKLAKSHERGASIRIADGDPAQAIRAAVVDLDADLVVMGTHSRGEDARYFLGSVAERVVRHPPCPVATVRPFGR